MRNRKTSRLSLLILLFFCSGQIINAQQSNALEENPIRIICNPSNNLEKISKNKLRAIFSMHLQEWPDGNAVTVYVLADRAPSHQNFAKATLGYFPYQLRRRWDKLVFSGTGDAPIVVENLAQMKLKVSATKGAIGYLPSNLVDQKVKMLEVK